MPPFARPSAATLVAHRINKRRGLAPVLVDVSLTLGPRHRVGIIGPNGVGKTTLLRILAGEEEADGGSVRIAPPAATVGYLAQEPEAGEETLAALLARRTGVEEAERALTDASEAVARAEPGSDEDYAHALERFLSLGAADFEARRGEVLADLGLPARLLSVPSGQLSGGQRAKASLAALLLSRFDLLLLDEPTNDLDFEGLARLEGFLAGREGGLAVVSHDRAFLERVVTSVLELDEATHSGVGYAGGFAAYLEARATARRHAEEAYAEYVDRRDRLRERERTQRQWAVQGVARANRRPRDNDKAQRDFFINKTEKQAAKVRITEKALARLEVVDKPYQPWRLELDLSAARRSGDVVARLEGAVVRRGAWCLGPLDLEISWAERIALIGPNGSGKTTLLHALLGLVELDEGRRVLGSSVVVGDLGQERARFSAGGRPLAEEFLAATGLTLSEGRSLLAKFGIGAGDVSRSAASLSPGERTRVELALLMARGTNLLVLDEPTNHLDLPAIEQLEEALGAWEGTLILVTHDRRLLDAVEVTRRITIDEGRVVSDLPT